MQPKDPKWYFWRKRGWLRYPLLGLLIAGTAVALRGGLWSQTPAKAAKRAERRSLRAKTKPLPKVQMFLEHNERDINLKIKKGKYTLPSPVITREDQRVIVELAGVQVRPRKWTLSGSRVSSINVKVDKKGSRLVIAQDPKIKGTLKDAFSAEDVNGNLVLRVLNQSIGDRQNYPARPALASARAKIANASAAPVPTVKAKHPLSQKLGHKGTAQKAHAAHAPANVHHDAAHPAKHAQHAAPTHAKADAHHAQPAHHEAPAHGKVDTHHKAPGHVEHQVHAAAEHHAAPHVEEHEAAHHADVQVVEHPHEASTQAHEEAHETNHPTMLKSALSMAGSVLAFGLLALIPVLWWKKKQAAPAGDIKVQERLSLSPKHSLVRVQLGANDLWLGLSEGNIQVITPAQAAPARARPALSIAPEPDAAMTPPTDRLDEFRGEVLPEPMPAAAPPTLARRKLAEFKMRLKDALAHPDSDPEMDVAQDAGRQADAIRKELARRQNQEQEYPEPEMHEDVA